MGCSASQRRDTPWVFFFQAEDGIRDGTVTGVQTCALPIWPTSPVNGTGSRARRFGRPSMADATVQPPASVGTRPRSEERRVGKESRPRGAREHQEKQAVEGES